MAYFKRSLPKLISKFTILPFVLILFFVFSVFAIFGRMPSKGFRITLTTLNLSKIKLTQFDGQILIEMQYVSGKMPLIKFNDSLVTLQELPERIKTFSKTRPVHTIYIYGEDKLFYQSVIQIIDAIRGFDSTVQIKLVTDKPIPTSKLAGKLNH